MKRFVISGAIALLGGCCLWAQTQQGELPKAKTTTWRGILVDSGCPSSRSERPKVTSNSNSYPAVTSRDSFGLITADGKCIPFDVDSNEKVSGILKVRTNWSENVVRIKPTQVDVVGAEHGGAISVDEIQIR
jgi:hypothetical protein